MSNTLNIGSRMSGDKGRDAIHMAVLSVQCGEALHPGDNIGLVEGRARRSDPAKSDIRSIGIIDPFLFNSLEEGDWCWAFIYPGTVTGLRHHWFHPSLPDRPPEAMDAKKYSEMWLRDFAKRMNCYDEPEMAYQNMLSGLRDGELFFNGSDLHSYGDLDNPGELRAHAEAVLGEAIPSWDDFEYSCSC